MKKRNFVMQAAITSVLLASASAYAAVNLDAAPVVPALFAKEIAFPTTPIALTNAATILDITVKTGYSMNATEVRYVRLELDNGAKFSATATVTVAPAGGGTCSVGAVNGLGTSVIYFSLTAAGTGCNSDSVLTIVSGQSITNTNTISVQYSMFDQPSQAQAGGLTGRIVVKGYFPYISFGPSFSFTGAAGTAAVAGVEATPVAFGKIQNAASPSVPTLTQATLGSLDYKLVTPTPAKADGTAITLADLMKVGVSPITGTKLVVTGDFSAAGTVALPATLLPANVFLAVDAAACLAGTSALASVVLTATTATFDVGATPTTANPVLCYRVNGSTALPVTAYTASLNTVAASTAYTVASITGAAAGNINRNGTELQAPLFQTAGSAYLSRFVLTNTSGSPAAFTINIRGETGNTITAGPTTSGTIPANGMIEVPAASVATFSGASRGFAVFSVSAPNNVIQGVHQTVNIASGAISTIVMVRPGTN